MALSSTALITLSQAKCYLGITTESSDAVLEALIERATGFLERYCNRKLKTQTYSREIYYGTGRPNLILDQYPATTISRVSIGRTNAFSITNTTATNHATVEITATALKYSADGAAATSLTLSAAAYDTLAELVAFIEALDGWSATLLNSSYGSRKSSDLLIRPGMYCKSPTSAYCEIPNDELTDYYLLSPTEDRNYGVLYNPSGWTQGEEYFVDYTAGYTTVPYALEEAALLLVAYRYNQRDQDTSLKSESLGDYSYTRQDLTSVIPNDLREEIDLYRKRAI